MELLNGIFYEEGPLKVMISVCVILVRFLLG